MRTVYTSDPHHGHANIITFARRPFANVQEMDEQLHRATLAAIDGEVRLVNCGDIGWNMARIVERLGPLPNAERHIGICGNHDRVKTRSDLRPFHQWFGRFVGVRGTWREHYEIVWDEWQGKPVRVLCSHEPQLELHGCDYNVYGHVHNNVAPPWNEFNEGYRWLLDSPHHLNACVEMTGYRPRDLGWLIYEQLRLVHKRGTEAAPRG